MKLRLMALGLMLFFVAGAWLWPSQAQRATQKSAPRGASPRAKASAAKTSRLGQKGETLTPIYSQAVNFVESAPVRTFGPVNRAIVNSKSGPPEVRNEGHEINEKNSEEVRLWVDGKSAVDAALQPPPNTKAVTALPTPRWNGADVTFMASRRSQFERLQTNSPVSSTSAMESFLPSLEKQTIGGRVETALK